MENIDHFQGNNLLLRKVESKDIETLWQLIYGQENPAWKEWDGPFYPLRPISLQDYREIFEKHKDDALPSRLLIETDGKIIGTVSFYWLDEGSKWMEFGICIYEEQNWNQGYGKEALTLWIDYLFKQYSLVRLGFSTWSGNKRMLHCAEKLGMQQEACIRKARQVKGQFFDNIKMGILREEWHDKNGT